MHDFICFFIARICFSILDDAAKVLASVPIPFKPDSYLDCFRDTILQQRLRCYIWRLGGSFIEFYCFALSLSPIISNKHVFCFNKSCLLLQCFDIPR